MENKNKKQNGDDNAGKKQTRFNKHLHPVTSWVSVAAVSLSSFLIISTVLAQVETITQPFTPTPGATYDQNVPPGNVPMTDPGAMLAPSGDPSRTESAPPTSGIAPVPSGDLAPSPANCPVGTNCGGQPIDQPGYNQPNSAGQPGGEGMPGQNGEYRQPTMGEPGQTGDQGRMGPSEEDQKKMDEQRFTQMKKGFTRFIKEVNRIKNQVNIYKKKGVTIPEDLTSAIGTMDEMVGKIKSATTPDELEEIMDSFQDSMMAVQEWMPKLPILAEIPRIVKQAEKEIARAEKAYKTDEKKVKSSQMDLADYLSQFRLAIDTQKAILEEAKGIAKSDPEEALEKIRGDFFGTLDNMWEGEKIIQMALNLKKGISQMNLELNRAEKTLRSLKKKKLDTSELQTLLTEAKNQFAQIKKMASAKPLDVEAVIEAIDELVDKKQEFADIVEDLTGASEYMPQASSLPNKPFQLNMPAGYIIEGTGDGGSSSMQTCNVNGVEMPGKCEDYQPR